MPPPLKPNPFQKRKNYGDIPSLAESIAQRGLQNPISELQLKDGDRLMLKIEGIIKGGINNNGKLT